LGVIVHPSAHWFQAKYPTLEDAEEEVFYQHPVLAIKVNQLGVIYCDDTFGIYEKGNSSAVTDLAGRKSYGTKCKIIFECYAGEVVYSPHFFFANANPLDLRRENLVLLKPLSAKQREPYIRIKRQFAQASVEHLLGLEARMQAVGIDRKQLYEMLLLPRWLKGARERYVLPAPPKPRKIYSKGATKKRTTVEEAEQVVKLYHMGLTFYSIIDRMGWTSSSRIKKIVRDYNLVR
jgi:hypothetical protein